MNIGIIDYGMGNIRSITNAVNHLHHSATLVRSPDALRNYSFIILPGVGAFAQAMAKLKMSGMDEAIIESAKDGKKILGICLGMQLLFSKSYEFGETAGLDLIKGDVIPFTKEIGLKIPHIGWNEAISENPHFKDFSGNYYFVHSYYCFAQNKKHVLFSTNYGFDFCSAASVDNHIFGVQFHPEKSQHLGLRLLKQILD